VAALSPEQTKNVAGRLLVGLRYWNEVTDEGSNWRFETLEAVRTHHPLHAGKAYAVMLFLQLQHVVTDLELLAGHRVRGQRKCPFCF